MKKLIIFLIILSQILWIFSNYRVNEEEMSNILTIEVRGYSGFLIKTIYSDLMNNLKKIIELSDLIPHIIESTKNEEKNNQGRTILYFYSQNFNLNENIKKLEENNVQLVISNYSIPKFTLNLHYCYNLFWLMTILFIIGFYFLKPRSCIDDILYMGLRINPNWTFWGKNPIAN